jgi:hypothetical protein
MSFGTIEINGRRYELPDITNPTIREAKRIKAATGMPPVRLMTALQEADPDAWAGVALMAMQAIDPRIGEQQLEDLDLFQVMASFQPTEDVEASDDPPVVAGAVAAPADPATSSPGA